MTATTQSSERAKTKDLLKRLKEVNAAEHMKNDIERACLFSMVFQDKHRYCPSSRDWFVYENGVWVLDGEGMSARADMKRLGKALGAYVLDLDVDEDKKKSLLRFSGNWLKSSYRNQILLDSRDINYFVRDDLDKDVFLLNCQNGVLSLKDGNVKFFSHKPELLLSKMTGTEYVPAAACPRWTKFIEEVTSGDTGKAKYLQKMAGLALVGDVPEHKFFILFGPTTRNGKSTFAETLLSVMGTYGATIDPASLAKQKADSRRASGDIARLAGVRLAICSEAPKSMPLDSALLKKLTGGDRILARHLMEREFEFVPQFTIAMNTNYLPSTSDTTVFSSGRISVIEFQRHFEEAEQDKHLKEKLLAESAGILNWMIKGYQIYLAEGLQEPESIRATTKTYSEESDRMGCFVEECLLAEPGKLVALKDVYPVYQRWCDECGYSPLGKQGFIAEMKQKRYYRSSGTVGGKTVRNVIFGFSGFVKTTETFENLTG